jgi:hypothetical protein
MHTTPYRAERYSDEEEAAATAATATAYGIITIFTNNRTAYYYVHYLQT